MHSTWDPLFTSGGRASFYLVRLFPRLGDAAYFEPGVLSIWAMHLIIIMQYLEWYTSVTVLVLAPQVDYRPLKAEIVSHASVSRHNHLGILLNRRF